MPLLLLLLPEEECDEEEEEEEGEEESVDIPPLLRSLIFRWIVAKMPWLIVSLPTMMVLQLSWNYYPFFSPPPPPPPFDRSMVSVLSLRGVGDEKDENATTLFTNDARESSNNAIIRNYPSANPNRGSPSISHLVRW
jgi:hypothetical protein